MSISSSILALSQELISIRSEPDKLKELETCLDICLAHLKNFTVEKFERNGAKSLLIYNTKTRPEKFKIILNGHLDVIPAKDFQYRPIIKRNRLYGAGAMDMKSNVACMVYSFKEMAHKIDYPLALQLVTDEETGGFDGTKYQIENGIQAEFIIAGEATNFEIVSQARGVLLVKIIAQGQTAHGAYPWRGQNALWKLNNFLNNLQQVFPHLHEENWQTTINLAKIETDNTSFNKIPDMAIAWLDIRFVPKESESILETIKSLLNEGLKLEIIANESVLFVEEKNLYLQKLQESARKITHKESKLRKAYGTSDARHFTKVKNNGVEFGPIGGGIGTDEEWVDISSLATFYEILNNFLSNLEN